MTAVNSVSVLARLTSDVMAEKKAAAGIKRTLTPVAGEVASTDLKATTTALGIVSGPLPDVGAPFPFEHPTENIVTAIRAVRKQLSVIDEALVAVERIIYVPTPFDAEVDAQDRVLRERGLMAESGINRPALAKAAEAAADAKAKDPAFADRFAHLKQEAEKATYKDGETMAEESMRAQVTPGWLCPTHGKSVKKTSTKTGRPFTGCPDCNLFER